jgi:hypothetical protein
LRRGAIEAHAQALQFRLDELLTQGSAQMKTVHEPLPSSQPDLRVSVLELAPQPAVAATAALQRTSCHYTFEDEKSIIEKACARGPFFAIQTARSNSFGSAQDSLAAARKQEVCVAVQAVVSAASTAEQKADMELVAQLLELGVPQPWPATLCHLVKMIDTAPDGLSAPTLCKDLVGIIVASSWQDRMAVGEEVLVLENSACNLWKKATIVAHTPASDGRPGCFYNVCIGQAEPIKGMPANIVLPVEDGGAGALLRGQGWALHATRRRGACPGQLGHRRDGQPSSAPQWPHDLRHGCRPQRG